MVFLFFLVAPSNNILEVDGGTVNKYDIKKCDKIVFTEKYNSI